MKYIIMCGGNYEMWSTPRQLTKIHGEPIVARTIRLLRTCGIEDIAITSKDERFEGFGVPVIHMNNPWIVHKKDVSTGRWYSGFYIEEESVCYLFGDVVFSLDAIHTIVTTDTDDIEFFASAPPFAPSYTKIWAEPFAFKVQNMEHFKQALLDIDRYRAEGKFNREPIAWELWQVIKGTSLNKIDYTNYKVINDFTCDIDEPSDINKMLPYIDADTTYLIHSCNKRKQYVQDYLIPALQQQEIYPMVYNDDNDEGNLSSYLKSIDMLPDKGYTWHLQDDVVVKGNWQFNRFTRQTVYPTGIVCGFCNQFDKVDGWKAEGQMKAKGLVGLDQMWYSFPCIRIPNKLIKEFKEWMVTSALHNPEYRMWVRKNRYDDSFFMVYLQNYHPDIFVYNLKPNLVQHIDYLLGGSIVNTTRPTDQAISIYFEDEGEIEQVKNWLENN